MPNFKLSDKVFVAYNNKAIRSSPRSLFVPTLSESLFRACGDLMNPAEARFCSIQDCKALGALDLFGMSFPFCRFRLVLSHLSGQREETSGTVKGQNGAEGGWQA